MAGGGTPRQQMIGMMYLVLLAMLAMNASKDLLNAFVMLEHGIDKTVTNFSNANEAFYTAIDKAVASNPSAYKKQQESAIALRTKADEVVSLIADYKVQLTTNGELQTVADTANNAMKIFLDDNGIPLNKDNQDLGAGFFLAGDNDSEKGTKLTEAIAEFRDLVINEVDNDGDADNDYLKERYEKLFDTSRKQDPLDPSVSSSFAARISVHLPLASVTANLSLYQSYIRNAEADVVGHIASKMDGEGMVVDKSFGLVKFENGYVLKNDTVKGEIFLAAYNSKMSPKIYVGQVDTSKFTGGREQIDYAPGQTVKPPMIGNYTTVPANAGSGFFTRYAEEVGAQTISGVIENKTSKGTFFTKFKSSYMVAEPSATVAAEKMSVFYVGVKNPVAVSAPGVAISDIEVSAPGLVFKEDKPGKYTVVPRRATNKKGVDVVVKNKKSGAVLGKSNFRVKRLPDPAASVLGQKEGLISRGKLKAITRVDAKMENFDFDLSVTVQQFTLTVKVGTDLMSFKSNNNKLTPQMRKILTKVGRGSRIYFEDVKVKMPGGARKVPSLIFKVK